MTDEEYASEWPFTISDDEIELSRSLPHTLSQYHRDQRRHLFALRTNVEMWLGGYGGVIEPVRIFRKILWFFFRPVYEAVRPDYSGLKILTNEEANV